MSEDQGVQTGLPANAVCSSAPTSSEGLACGRYSGGGGEREGFPDRTVTLDGGSNRAIWIR